MEKKGIKEILEILDGIAILGEAGVKVAKGGIGVDDIPAVVDLAKNFEAISEAVKGASEAVKEARDLDQGEVVQIIGKIYEVVSKIEKAA